MVSFKLIVVIKQSSEVNISIEGSEELHVAEVVLKGLDRFHKQDATSCLGSAVVKVVHCEVCDAHVQIDRIILVACLNFVKVNWKPAEIFPLCEHYEIFNNIRKQCSLAFLEKLKYLVKKWLYTFSETAPMTKALTYWIEVYWIGSDLSLGP